MMMRVVRSPVDPTSADVQKIACTLEKLDSTELKEQLNLNCKILLKKGSGKEEIPTYCPTGDCPFSLDK
jgi:hypothetical protein